MFKSHILAFPSPFALEGFGYVCLQHLTVSSVIYFEAIGFLNLIPESFYIEQCIVEFFSYSHLNSEVLFLSLCVSLVYYVCSSVETTAQICTNLSLMGI